MSAYMKYKFIILFLLVFTGLGCDTELSSDDKYKQVYYDCYHKSQDEFKKIPRIDYVELKLEDMCNDESSFLGENRDEICLKACIDAFNHYK